MHLTVGSDPISESLSQAYPLVVVHGYHNVKCRINARHDFQPPLIPSIAMLTLRHLGKLVSLLEPSPESVNFSDKVFTCTLQRLLRGNLAISLDTELDGCEERVGDFVSSEGDVGMVE